MQRGTHPIGDVPSVRWTVARFALAGAAVLVGILIATTQVSRELGERQALDEARRIAQVTGVGVVQPRLDAALLAGDADALTDLDQAVGRSVLGGSLIRVKLWTTDGRIVYADEPRLVGERYAFAEDRQEAVDRGAVVAEVSDLSAPVAATAAITEELPATAVVVLTSLSEQDAIVRALDAGADGYLLKHAEPEEIARAIRAAAAGEAVLDPKAARALLDRGRTPQQGAAPADATAAGLSAREVDVLRLVVQGLANKQIGTRLGIAERTVKAHLTSTFSRLGVTDRTQAALWARDHLPDLGRPGLSPGGQR